MQLSLISEHITTTHTNHLALVGLINQSDQHRFAQTPRILRKDPLSHLAIQQLKSHFNPLSHTNSSGQTTAQAPRYHHKIHHNIMSITCHLKTRT